MNSCTICLLALGSFSGLSVAQDLSRFAGDWSVCDISSPARLQELFFDPTTSMTRVGEDSSDVAEGAEIITDIFFENPLFTSTRLFSIANDGAVTGEESGEFFEPAPNRLLFFDGSDAVNVYSNTSNNILATAVESTDSLNLSLIVKRPTAMTLTDIVDSWTLFVLGNPRDVETTLSGGRVVDTFFNSESELFMANINILGDGTFNGAFSGTVIVNSPGIVSFTTDPTEDPVMFQFNDSLNVGIATNGDSEDDDDQDFIIAVRSSSALTQADLAGRWRIHAIAMPDDLTEVYRNTTTGATRETGSDDFPGPGEELIDVFFVDSFFETRLQINVLPTGAVSGSLAGSFTLNPDNTVTFDFGEDPIALLPNGDGTFMAGGIAGMGREDTNQLITLIKTSDDIPGSEEEALDLRTFREGVALFLSWNDTDITALGASETLLPASFAPVMDSIGTGAHVLDLTSPLPAAQFFGVIEVEED